jgi:Ca-activated chloride channel family protein
MVGVMGNLMNGANCSMVQLALTSPIVADLENRPPLDLSVVVDTSGSMDTDGKIDFVRDGLGMLIDGLKDGDRFALITYSNDAQVVMPMDDVIGNRAAMRTAVSGLIANGGTNIYSGLQSGYQEVLQDYDSSRQNRVILLSDGQATSGITDTQSIIDMSRGLNSDGVGLTTVGLGTGFNVELMRDLALQADGNFYFLEDSGAVEEVFTEELSYFTVPIAFDLKMAVQSGPYYAFGEAHGTSFWENDNNGGSLDVPSVFIAHRESASDVTDSGGRRGGGSALLLEFMPTVFKDDGSGATNALIATVDVEFREPGTNEIVTDTVEVNYPRPAWVTEDAGYWDGPSTPVVQKSFVMLNAFVGMRNAVEEFHQAPLESTEAVAGLEALILAMEDYNEEIGDEDITADIALIRDLIDLMIVQGTPPPVIIPVDDPWPSD